MELRVNPILCVGHAACAELLPERIHLDEWGYPVLVEGSIPPTLGAQARQAVAACPTLALQLTRGSAR